MKFGEYIRQKRLDENLSLRKFCEVLKFDPSNWSKVERGRMPLTVDDEKLSELASILKINESEEENKFFLSLASLSKGDIPKEVYSDEEILNVLPILFRTAAGEKPTEEEKKRIIDLIKKR